MKAVFLTPDRIVDRRIVLEAESLMLAEERLEELRQFIEREKIGFLSDLSSPEKIAAALEGILSRKDELKTAKSRCIECAPRYSWEREGNRFADLVEEAHGASNSPLSKGK